MEVEWLEGQRLDVTEQVGLVSRRDDLLIVSEPCGPSGGGRKEVALRYGC